MLALGLAVLMWPLIAMGTPQLEGFGAALAYRIAEATLPLATLDDAPQPLAMEPGRREGGMALLVREGARPWLLLADEDARGVRIVDPKTLREQAWLPLPGRPAQLVVAGDGRVYVALRDQAEVWALQWTRQGDAVGLHRAATLSTASEPLGLAVSPDGDTLLVASGWGQRLAAYAMRTHRERFSLVTAPEPRAVTINPAGSWAYVAHARGDVLTAVKLLPSGPRVKQLSVAGADGVVSIGGRAHIAPGGDLRKAAQGYAVVASAMGVMAPLVLVHTGLLPRGPYGTSAVFPAHETALAHIHEDAVRLRVAAYSFGVKSWRRPAHATPERGPCLLPRAAVIDHGRQLLLVACLGEPGRVMAYTARDEALRDSTVAQWQVPAGPLGLTIDGTAGRAYVWSQYAGALSELRLPAAVVPARGGADEALATPLRSTILPEHTPAEGEGTMLSAAARRGRQLFHAADDPRLSRDGRACASCHPDGRADGITWPTPDGRLQTPMLAGRLQGNAPYGWKGASPTVPEHLTHTFARLGGPGLAGEELDALVAYLHELPPPPALTRPSAEALVKRGQTLFHSDGVGCASCHQQGDGSDGALHNVGSGRELDTPSLRYIAGSGPYFHDGRYSSLLEMLRATKGEMGWDAELSEPDLRALEAYLLTL